MVIFAWMWYNYKGKRSFVKKLKPSLPQFHTKYKLRDLGGIEMRLRRLEFIVLGVTLAFVCFMGGFFTGRSWSAVNIVAVAKQNEESFSTGVSIDPQERPLQVIPEDPVTPAPAITQAPQGEPETGQPQEIIGAPRDGDGKININLATQSELMDLPGIGNVLANRIVDYRRQHGDFLRIEDIRNVSGIGEKRYEAIMDKITVG